MSSGYFTFHTYSHSGSYSRKRSYTRSFMHANTHKHANTCSHMLHVVTCAHTRTHACTCACMQACMRSCQTQTSNSFVINVESLLSVGPFFVISFHVPSRRSSSGILDSPQNIISWTKVRLKSPWSCL